MRLVKALLQNTITTWYTYLKVNRTKASDHMHLPSMPRFGAFLATAERWSREKKYFSHLLLSLLAANEGLLYHYDYTQAV